MATVAWAELRPTSTIAPNTPGFVEAQPAGVRVFKWTGMAAADDGAWLPIGPNTEIYYAPLLEGGGSWGDSTLAMQGSLEFGTPTAGKVTVLQDGNGNDISGKTGATAEAGEQVMTVPTQIRPKLTGATGTGISVLVRLSTARAGQRG